MAGIGALENLAKRSSLALAAGSVHSLPWGFPKGNQTYFEDNTFRLH
jgi:hypothetical protein